MFLCALQPYVVFIIIAAVLLQYAFAVFCLLKLAYMDFDKKKYILWNLLILIVFYIGGVVFLVYYNKHPELRIAKDAPAENKESATEENQEGTEQADEPEGDNTESANDDNTDKE